MLVTIDVFETLKLIAGLVVAYYVIDFSGIVFEWPVPRVSVDPALAEPPTGAKKFDLKAHEAAGAARTLDQSVVRCWDPCTLADLGTVPTTSPADVVKAVARCRAAQEQWATSSFAQRRKLMRVMLRFVVDNQATIARVAVRDSGKTLTDAIFGEVLVTCEKLKWLAFNGERVLAPESRETGSMVWFTKKVHVEYRPLGVIGAIVPWNYPFHNVFNPVSAALMAGDGIVVKVSEYASWSAANYYGAALKACLKAAGAPEDLVQIVHGYGPTGAALVGGGVDKVIFVGSPGIGAKVMEHASKTLTPVVLELGGKDPFVVCDDVGEGDLDRIAQIALRGVFQSMGQNCAGPERFFVGAKVYDGFLKRIKAVADQLVVGASNDDPAVDCGAVVMGGLSRDRLQSLVDDAVARGATILSQGKTAPSKLEGTSFFPPTVLYNVPMTARLATEEIFGPIMCIFVPTTSDDDAVAKANACGFGLSSCAFAASTARAAAVATRLKAGMSSVNDLEGTTYLSQSLPFGGVGESGFDKFAGPEGLRGLCLARSCCADRVGLLRTSIPGPIQYPSKGKGHVFAMGLVELFYGNGLLGKIAGIFKLIKAS
mmetsp:Transcript_35117/g.108797  ORF Transcript_35117/g.108797 Transcript_35117/m.108797 type:complete len:598 (-) Transcript_35117:64-1857(-)